jgi:tetratricopeptide (TPR) repeat protein
MVAWLSGTTTELTTSLPDITTTPGEGEGKGSSVIRPKTVGPRTAKDDATVPEKAGPTSSEWRHRIATGELTPVEERHDPAIAWREQALAAVNQANRDGAAVQRLCAEADALLAAGKDKEALDQYLAACHNDPKNVPARVRAATLLSSMGKWDDAATVYEEALRLEPRNPRALRGLAETELQRGHQRAAVGLARILVGCDDTVADSHLLLARSLLADNNAEEALTSAKRARQLSPDRWESRLLAADCLAALSRFDQAEEQYLQLAADDPEVMPAYLGAARCRERLGGGRQALAYLESLAEPIQAGDDIACMAARLLQELGENAQAIARYREIVRRNASPVPPRLALAKLLLEEGKLADCQELLAGILTDSPTNTEARLALARLYLRTGLPELATKHAGMTLGKDEERNRLARRLLAQAEAACGREQQAVRLLRENLAAHPTDLPSHRLLVECLLRTGNADEALAAVKQVEEQFPDRPDAASLRGDVYASAADYEQAIGSYREALAQAPEDPEILRRLADILCQQEAGIAEADSLSAKALQRAPRDPAVMDTRGWVLHRLGKLDAAALLLDRATRLAPGRGKIHYHFGVVLTDLGKKELAIQELRRALSSATVFAARPEAQKRLASLLLAPDDE